MAGRSLTLQALARAVAAKIYGRKERVFDPYIPGYGNWAGHALGSRILSE